MGTEKVPMRQGTNTGPTKEEMKQIINQRKNEYSKEELELAMTYESLPEEFGVNVISRVYGKTIQQLSDMLSSFRRYSDSRIYKTIPRRLMDILKDIEKNNIKYYPQALQCNKSKQVIVVPADFEKCSCCGKYFQIEEFNYKDGNVNRGGSYYCSSCAQKFLQDFVKKYKDIREALIVLSQKMDYIVLEQTLTGAVDLYDTVNGQTALKNGTFAGWYFGTVRSDCNTMGIPEDCRDFSHSKLSGVPFKCIKEKYGIEDIYDDQFVENGDEDDDDELMINKASLKALKHKWGNYPPEKLKWLAQKEMEWYNNYDISGKSREMLVQQLCFEEWEIYNGRNQGEDVSEHIKVFQSLLKTSELTPKLTAGTSTQEFQTLGDFIKHVEQKRPFINKDPEFEDVDGITKIWKAMVGALSRTAGKPSPYIADFEENMKDYTVDVFEESINNEQ